jgi:tetratricopeptide (TPR) repeat protein
MTFRRSFFALLVIPLGLLVVSCGESPEPEPPEVREAAELVAENRVAEAYELLEAAVEREPDSVAHLVAFAETCQRLGRVRKGVRAIERARELAPDSPRALFVSAQLDRDRHRPADAIASVRRAAELRPKNVDSRILLGNLLIANADHAGAVEAFEAAHRLAPDDPRALGGHGQALILVGRHEEGEPLIDGYLEQFPNDGDALYLRGLARFRAEDFDAAETDFRRAIAVAPHLPAPYHNLARILQASGRTEEAASMRERHREINDRDWAIRAAQRKLAGDPNDDATARELARLLRQAGRNAEAAAVQKRQ